MFKVGDVVELKSGGPIMTVSDVYNDGTLRARWFLDGKIQIGEFSSPMLNAVEM